MNEIRIYESMSEVSARMVEAARANDWDRLAALERDVASMRDTLATPRSTGALPLSVEERSRKLRLIHRILDDDAEIRRHTEPWMEHVSAYLGRNSRARAVNRAYGSVAGG